MVISNRQYLAYGCISPEGDYPRGVYQPAMEYGAQTGVAGQHFREEQDMFGIGTLVRISATVTVTGVLCAVSWPGQAAAPAFDVIVDNPITLNPATPNPVTVVSPPNAPLTVNIGNPAAIAKAEGIQHPFSTEIQCQATNGAPCEATFNAPPNQRLVLEYIGAHCGMSSTAQLAFAEIGATNAGAATLNFLGLNSVVAGAVNSQSVAQLMRIYVDAGTTVTVTFSISSITASANCGGGIQGQAINVP
jgi:hypothetical protein